MNLTEKLKENTIAAAYGSAATQISLATKKAILLFLQKAGHNTTTVDSIAKLLDSKLGEAMVSALLGLALPNIPQIANNENASKVTDKFIENAIKIGMDETFGVISDAVFPILKNAVRILPKVKEEKSLPQKVTVERQDQVKQYLRVK